MTIRNRTNRGVVVMEENVGSDQVWPGGIGSYHVFGTFAGSDSVKLKFSGDGGSNWVDIPDASWTENATGEFSAGKGMVRAVPSIAGASSINVILSPP